ncbi:MAG TPA: ATP-dependent RecD-like DNA helicase, partial [Longimicrobiaceae bacterium]|nr:ATP-dependent RecD-like DNA helicase [Longimicrobiaceae bacterium]
RITVVGNLPAVAPGERVEATGAWKHDRVHGRQFEAETLAIDLPTTRQGIERYLGSGMIRGVGPHLAKLIVAEFGPKTLEIIETMPKRLERVSGIGKRRALMISESWREQKSVRDLMLFLAPHGVGAARALRIHKQYGANAVGLIRENPYRLADEVRGIGFRSADAIALSLGFDRSSPFRARAGIVWVLAEASSGNGHCAVPRDELIRSAGELLGVDAAVITEAIHAEVERRTLAEDQIRGREVVALTWLHRAEREIAQRLAGLASGAPPWPSFDVEKAIPWARKKLSIDFADEQAEALRTVLRSKVSVVTGGPGVGKTTLVNAILAILEVKDVDVELAAPTGRAAKRMTESTGRAARTIHRLLEVNAKTLEFGRNESNPLECDLLIVDETSMIDVPLMQSLLRAVPPESAVLLVGDVDQLPPVGPGQILADIIESKSVPVVRLTKIFRQAAASRIVINAHRVNQGLMPDLAAPPRDQETDFYFVAVGGSEEAVAKLLQIVGTRIPRRFGLDPLRDIQVLAPMHKGLAGVRSLNTELQKLLNPAGLTSPDKLERLGNLFAPGDKVMQIENNYDKDVFNGDLGIIRSIDTEEGIVVVAYENAPVEYTLEELEQIVLAYATTIHKAQGSEYPAVVIPLLAEHHVMLQRNLLYTAMTRGRRLVVLIGQQRAVATAVRQSKARMRWTKLREL